MNRSARLSLPLLSPGQAQKELLHNEAIQALDFMVAAAVEGPPQDAPPSAPAVGATHLVGASPTGAWLGHAGAIAGYSEGGWRFLGPVEGMTCLIRSEGIAAVYRLGAWEMGELRGSALVLGGDQVAGPRQSAIPDPAGGSVSDNEARTAIGSILAALRQHGMIAT